MLNISFIKKNKKKVLRGLNKRCFFDEKIINEIISLDDSIIKLKNTVNLLRNKINIISKIISKNIKKPKIDIKSLIKESSFYKEKQKKIIKELFFLKKKIKKKILTLPNVPYHKVKSGKNKKDNEEIYKHISCNNIFDKKSLPHWELSKKYKLFSFHLGNEISGKGFPVYFKNGALLIRSLVRFFLDENIKKGYIEYDLPFIVNEKSVFSTGNLPDKENIMYKTEKDNYYLIPTGEVPIMNCYKNIILSYKELPIKATCHTHCFRRESGSYGSLVRGLNRIHQFNKVEIIQITNKNKSFIALKNMINHVKLILKKLNLPFRIIKLCARDMGFTSSITYDFEVYSLVQKKWLEVSSVTNCTDFQSNRLNLKYKNRKGSINYCHTLNGSCLSIPRILVTILENNQTSKGILIPKILIPYFGKKIIKIN